MVPSVLTVVESQRVYASDEAIASAMTPGVLERDDFVLKNLQGVAICSALSKNVEYEEVEQRLLGEFADKIAHTVLNHNVRSSYIAVGMCVLYAKHDKVSEAMAPRFERKCGHLVQRRSLQSPHGGARQLAAAALG